MQIWNKVRIGQFILNTNGGFAVICGWEWWQVHDAVSFNETWGVGFGEYLDPSAPARVQAKFAAGDPGAKWYAVSQLASAVARRPLDALTFKLERWPVLWLGTDRWPRTVLDFTAYWCLGTYAVFFAYLIRQRWLKRRIPEIIWLYPLFALLMSFLTHSEFRYSFPCWGAFVMTPGLLWDSLRTRSGQVAAVTAATATIANADKSSAAPARLCA